MTLRCGVVKGVDLCLWSGGHISSFWRSPLHELGGGGSVSTKQLTLPSSRHPKYEGIWLAHLLVLKQLASFSLEDLAALHLRFTCCVRRSSLQRQSQHVATATMKRPLREVLGSDSDVESPVETAKNTSAEPAGPEFTAEAASASAKAVPIPDKRQLHGEGAWITALQEVLEPVFCRVGRQTRPFRVQTGCSGTNAPLMCFKALRDPTRESGSFCSLLTSDFGVCNMMSFATNLLQQQMFFLKTG